MITLITHRPLRALGLSLALMAGLPAAWAEADAQKKELVAKLLKLQKNVIEGLAEGLVEQPANQLLQQADTALQSRVPKDKQADVIQGVRADIKKYLDDTSPIIKAKAITLAPSTIGKMLEEKFSKAELKQLITILESPVNRRLHELGPEMQRSLSEKLVSESRVDIEPKIRELQGNLSKRFGANTNTNASTNAITNADKAANTAPAAEPAPTTQPSSK